MRPLHLLDHDVHLGPHVGLVQQGVVAGSLGDPVLSERTEGLLLGLPFLGVEDAGHVSQALVPGAAEPVGRGPVALHLIVDDLGQVFQVALVDVLQELPAR